MKVAVINGPNLNLLGTREPELYGSATLQDVEELLSRLASDLNVALTFFQSNVEGELVDEIQRRADCDAIILNPGGYGHTSIALADAISGVGVPTVEVHVQIFMPEKTSGIIRIPLLYVRHRYLVWVYMGIRRL